MKMAGKIYSAIRSLYGQPFFFEDGQVERCVQLAFAVEKCLLVCTQEFAKQENCRLAKAKFEILRGRATLPNYGKVVVPTVWDIAALVKPWIIYVEDEEDDQEEVRRLARARKVEVLIVREDTSLLEQIRRCTFLQCWVDLGLGSKGETEIGKRLLNTIEMREYSVNGEVIVITQHARANFLTSLLRSNQVKSVIDKGKQDTRAKVGNLIDKGTRSVREKFGFWPDNPLLRRALDFEP